MSSQPSNQQTEHNLTNIDYAAIELLVAGHANDPEWRKKNKAAMLSIMYGGEQDKIAQLLEENDVTTETKD